MSWRGGGCRTLLRGGVQQQEVLEENVLQLSCDAVETLNQREWKEERWLISRWPPIHETFYEDVGVPGTKPDAVDVVIVKLRAAIRDEVYQTFE